MAECGIKKYDMLPSRVGWIDVDYLRWRLYRCDNPTFLNSIPIIGWLLTPPSDLQTRQNIITELEKARDEVKRNGLPPTDKSVGIRPTIL